MSDPFKTLENAARAQKAGDEAKKAIEAALVRGFLFEHSPARAFFTSLATKHLYAPASPESGIDTAATDGKTVHYSPDFVNGLSFDELVGLLAHEALHPGMGHHARRGDRNPKQWNISCDLEINPILREAGYTLPKGGLFPGEGQFRNLPKGLTAEEYYNLLPSKGQDQDGPSGQPGNKKGNGKGQGSDPGQCGGVLDAGDEAEQQSSAADWKVAVAQAAAIAKGRGTLPGGLARLVDQLLNPKVKWQDVLADFVQRSLHNRDDFSWRRPNRRHIAAGLYLPTLIGEEVPDIVVAVDTSGSIDQGTLAQFSAELNEILEASPAKVTVVYCDCRVQATEEWNRGDGPLTLNGGGGGGTAHQPVWDHLVQMDNEPACVIALTDGQTDHGRDPGVPVLWCVTPGGNKAAPFGRVVEM